MLKILVFLHALVFFVYIIFSEKSSLPHHSFFFKKGESIYKVVKKDGAFSASTLFFIIEKISLLTKDFQTGEYDVLPGESAFSVFRKVVTGNCITRKLTIPEGLTVQIIVEMLNKNECLVGEISELPDEASLMPNTYFYKFQDTRKSIIKKMENQMQLTLKKLSVKNHTEMNMKEILILASIIEKEVKAPEEMQIVSSVYNNRLKKKMRLQSCPTVIYAVSHGYGRINRPLTKEDLFFKSPYNTYRVNGIPPTPICCPGEKAIEAAMNPVKTNYLYFVLSEDNVRHNFSVDYQGQLKNKRARKNRISNGSKDR
jgi:UPF0755 protein